MDERLKALEEEVAHLRKSVDDLSDVVARQSREIDLLTRRMAMLMQRAAEAETEGSGGIPLADQKPPHW
ncbi:MAG TPA: SlyX family protein [Albidovulum sp.]|uniref:SlyX family protein n=1 Tax=Albidovulum sp. TaxID=1872424 RepID=UPI002C5FAC5B|nr:SlyX family protein [Albidovulum sp.]